MKNIETIFGNLTKRNTVASLCLGIKAPQSELINLRDDLAESCRNEVPDAKIDLLSYGSLAIRADINNANLSTFATKLRELGASINM